MLGLVVYEMIAGAPPVRVSTWAELLDPDTAALLLHPRPLKDVADGCDERVSDVVMRMLSVDPESRWDGLEAVARELEDALSHTSCVEAAKDSYRRCARDDRFYQVLYDHLFDAMPEIRGMFATRSMAHQYQVLRDALWLLLSYPETRPQGDPTILSGIARTHAHYQPHQFDVFRDAVLAAVAACDSRGPHVVEAWRGALAPGIDYLKGKAGAMP
jgi:hemoglobin-like flavoprotein